MKKMKRLFCLLTMALLSFALLVGCGKSDKSDNSDNSDDSGRKFRDTDVIDDYCTITLNGMQINVCVCHDLNAIYIYYDDEKHELFDIAIFPTDEFYDDDNDWVLSKIYFSDFTGDGNDDLEVYISHSDMSESHIVWMWEEDAGYVYQPDNSWFYDTIVIYDPPTDDTAYEFSIYEGGWLSDEDNLYDGMYIEFDGEGNWQLYSGGDVIDDGYLYVSEEGITCICSYQGGTIDSSYIEVEGDQLYIATLGYFSRFVSEDDSYSDDSGLYQRDISEFEGVWYYDNDLSAETYIIIDEYGNWDFFQRVPGEAEATEIDYGTLSYSADEVSTYYADSAVYDGVQYRMFDFDEGIIIWDEDTYYRME